MRMHIRIRSCCRINEVALLVHLRRGALPRPQVGEVVSVQVTGAGSEVANGVFVRDGVYTGFASISFKYASLTLSQSNSHPDPNPNPKVHWLRRRVSDWRASLQER